ncbi:hypothetical protein PIB19_00360 [Sphingomonas sp. 7/4-4]|uniref:hypothetical protein n=1 Tax=Sphingomonas sp. 7/4-4 TaxID=3018446 RepID=UPI0022F3FFDC|nr:hypothetical protein [Sphingomonas sp. 7/4-4]WBY08057.1 hypothetical protein PIB19_00360 [Sphingomonas sp. 7/4-4]
MRFETQTPEAEPVTITLIAKACAAGKETLPLGAEVRIGNRTLKGCAGPGAYDWAARKASPRLRRRQRRRDSESYDRRQVR